VDGKTFTNNIGMEFVLIPAGTFIMGSPDSDAEADDEEKPAHCVTSSQPFYLGKYPVTQAQWEAVMGHNPSRFKGNPNRPVEAGGGRIPPTDRSPVGICLPRRYRDPPLPS
jgi:formylglycine-generating enzyme required for sulfatase activity